METHEPFELRNDPPDVKARFASNNSVQRVLFTGLDCLKGQGDLFNFLGSKIEHFFEREGAS